LPLAQTSDDGQVRGDGGQVPPGEEPTLAADLDEPGAVFIDIFRSHDLSGWAKAGWLLFVLFIPLIGVLVYLIARGGSMHERAAR